MDYYIVVLYIAALLLAAYKAFAVKNTKELLMFMGFLIISWVLFNYEGYSTLTTTLLSGFIIFNAVTSFYGRKSGNILLLLAVYYVAVTWNLGGSLIIQSAVIGALSSPRLYSKSSNRNVQMRVENLRNIFQITAGVFFMLLFIFVQQYASLTLLLIFMAGMAVSNYTMSSKGGLFKILSKMEREGFDFGHGAFWLGIGALFAAGFLSTNMILVVFSAIFIADSMSTIAGVHYGRAKLPYNKKKSAAGTFAYLLTVLVISFPLLSYYALPVAIVAALMESLPLHIDDNFGVSFVLTALLILLPL